MIHTNTAASSVGTQAQFSNLVSAGICQDCSWHTVLDGLPDLATDPMAASTHPTAAVAAKPGSSANGLASLVGLHGWCIPASVSSHTHLGADVSQVLPL